MLTPPVIQNNMKVFTIIRVFLLFYELDIGSVKTDFTTSERIIQKDELKPNVRSYFI